MKVIELAQKQRNNETLPKHIKYENEDLYFDGVTYYDKEGNNDLFDILAMNNNALTHLYDEVEIIEEEQDIEELKVEMLSTECFVKQIENKVNELVRAVNELRGKHE